MESSIRYIKNLISLKNSTLGQTSTVMRKIRRKEVEEPLLMVLEKTRSMSNDVCNSCCNVVNF